MIGLKSYSVSPRHKAGSCPDLRRIPADAICSIYLLYNFLYSYNAVTAGPDQFTVVRYHQDCSASALQFFEEYGGFFHMVEVQSAGRFIAKQDLPAGCDGAGDSQERHDG